jgi:CubicO group peptidase (beta-lactamase class C family)
MRKWLFISLVPLVGLVVLMKPLMGVSPQHLPAAVEVATGMAAKLACSGRYISGLSEQQVFEDVASYSPANRLLEIDYDTVRKTSTASMFGFSNMSARFRESLGCTLDIGDTSSLDAVRALPAVVSEELWPAGSRVDSIVPGLQRSLDQLLDADNRAGLETRALLVVGAGAILAESYATGFDAATPLLGWSMGKSLTSIMLGQLEYQGELDVQSRRLFPEWSGDERADISIENLLQMSSGLDFDETYAPGSDSTEMLFTAHSASDVARASPPLHPPGEYFYYSSGTTNMLAQLWFDRVGGSTQQAVEHLQRQILQPLGMVATIFEPDPSGVFVGSSYIYASTRDWARLGLLMLNEGELNGTRLLSQAWVERARAPNASDNDPRYGYQFWLNRGGEELRWPALPEDAYAMLGNRHQTVMIVPSRRVVLVRLGWTAASYPMAENFSALLQHALY